MNQRPSNKGLHLPKRVGVPASRAVVEGRFAGEARCSADVTHGSSNREPMMPGRAAFTLPRYEEFHG